MMYHPRFLGSAILFVVSFSHACSAHAHDAEAPPVAGQTTPVPPALPAPAPTTNSNSEIEMPSRWAGNNFGAGYSANLSTLGVQSDDLSQNDEFSAVSVSLSPGYFLVMQPKHQLRLSTALALSVTSSNSNSTAQNDDVSLNDIPLLLSYTMQPFSSGKGRGIGGQAAMTDPTLLVGEGAYRTWLHARANVYFPTSAHSRSLRQYPNIGASIGIRQQFRLLGDGAAGLTYLLLSFNESWSHTF